LPFDDDNLRILLEKVKKGVFTIPAYVQPDCIDLINKMITVNPDQRYSLDDVQKHPFYTKNAEEIPPEPPLPSLVDIKNLACAEDLDIDVLSSMNCLGCFKDRDKLVEGLLIKKKNVEKVIYFLLLDRKSRRPATKDDAKALIQTQGKELSLSSVANVCLDYWRVIILSLFIVIAYTCNIIYIQKFH